MKNIFHHFFKGLSLKQIKQIFLEGEGPTLNNHTEDHQLLTEAFFKHNYAEN